MKKITRKFMNDLADRIHNPKKKTFLRLCPGTLQNGPDPVDGKRTMHCGLGELYYAATGHQPETDGVNEEAVVDAITEAAFDPDGKRAAIVKKIKAMKLPESVEEELILVANDLDDDWVAGSEGFRCILGGIPGVNDKSASADFLGHNVETDASYCRRSKAVAAQLRKAARLIPE